MSGSCFVGVPTIAGDVRIAGHPDPLARRSDRGLGSYGPTMRSLDVIWAGGIVALALGCRSSAEPDTVARGRSVVARDARPLAPAGSVLALDLAVVRYRFADAPAPEAELSSAIRDLEARVKEPVASPFDITDLAELYLRRAQRDGDDADYRASEAMARRSLDLLPFPNGARLTLAKLAGARHDFREAIRHLVIGDRFFLERSDRAGHVMVVNAVDARDVSR